MRTSQSGNAGFTLIEVLVSVFVLVFGVIAMAALQLTALRIAQQTTYQSTAVQLASELAEIMRAHPTEVDTQKSLFFFDDTASGNTAAEPPMLCYPPNICNENQSAHFQLYEWRRRLQTILPGGKAAVCRDSTPWGADDRKMTWQCEANEQAGIVIKIGWIGKNDRINSASTEASVVLPGIAMIVEVSQKIKHAS